MLDDEDKRGLKDAVVQRQQTRGRLTTEAALRLCHGKKSVKINVSSGRRVCLTIICK